MVHSFFAIKSWLRRCGMSSNVRGTRFGMESCGDTVWWIIATSGLTYELRLPTALQLILLPIKERALTMTSYNTRETKLHKCGTTITRVAKYINYRQLTSCCDTKGLGIQRDFTHVAHTEHEDAYCVGQLLFEQLGSRSCYNFIYSAVHIVPWPQWVAIVLLERIACDRLHWLRSVVRTLVIDWLSFAMELSPRAYF